MDREMLQEIKAREEKAHQVISDLCNGRRRWIMSIPAQEDYDPDLVIGASLRDIPTLLSEIDRLQKIEKTAEEAIRILKAIGPERLFLAAGCVELFANLSTAIQDSERVVASVNADADKLRDLARTIW